MSQSSGSSFVHLHVHTHYSLLDGATRIDELVRSAKAMGMPAVAITDHGNMFGAIEFYRAAQSAGVKPIIGLEAYIADGDRRARVAKSKGDAAYHLLLLAKDNLGYQNLLKLASIGYCQGFYYVPRIDKEVLEAHSEGLICTSTCLGAEIPQMLVGQNRAKAEEVAEWYLKVFGTERFFIELQDHGIPEQKMINPELIDIARRLGVGLIASNDVHYLRPDDVEAHDVLCCISTRALQSDEDRFKFPSDQFFLKSPEQMAHLFPGHAEAIANTVRVAEMCNVELDFKKRHTPVYRPPDSKSAEDYLRELVYQGALERYGAANAENGKAPPQSAIRKEFTRRGGQSAITAAPPLPTDLKERIDYELSVIQSKGFSSYFLICWDFVHYARGRGIPCGARGSGCSSVVAYCLYLSQPDPLRYGLYFERFMDPDRDEMPDIDIDICQDGREEVLEYVRRKYGHVAQIITFGTLKARAVIRDVCRVLAVPLAEADRIAKLVPEELKMTLEKALAQEPELKRLYDSDERVRKVIDIGKRLEGLSRHAGVHAAGVVIADQPLDELLPLYKASDSEALITQFEGGTVEKVGLLKMDFLGLRTLSVLTLACKLAEQHHGAKIDLEALKLADQRVYELFAAGQTKGVFQFESGGMRDVLMKMRPNRIEDLIAANALYRPGPMVNIDAYIARKHGERWSTPHKSMDEVLAETYGIIVYQEQVARLVNLLGGIERKRAFRLAKAISKKKTDMIEAEREPFVQGAVRNGMKKSAAEEVFNQILPFGEYAFNKAHSTGYALVAFQTAYVKTYYPLEFMAALLTYEMGSTEKVVEYIEECRRLGIDVRPPDINSSDADFTVIYDAKPVAQPPPAVDSTRSGYLRFGLAAIKGVGEKAVACIAGARREGGRFANLFDFCERVDLQIVNRGVIEALIKAGAFDTTGAMRKALILALDKALSAAASFQRDRASGQLSIFGGAPEPPPAPTLSTEEWSEAEMLAQEKSVLGFYVTSHPLAKQSEQLRRFASADCADMKTLGDGTEIIIGGMISRLRLMTTRNGRNAGSKLAVLTVEDLSGAIEAVAYSETMEKHRELIGPDRLVFLRGTVDRRREDPSLRVSEVFSLEEGPARLAEAVIVAIKPGHATKTTLAQLRTLCENHRGDRNLFLRLEGPGGLATLVRCEAALSVRPDASFAEHVNALLGRNAVEIIGRRRIAVREQTQKAETPAEEEQAELAAV